MQKERGIKKTKRWVSAILLAMLLAVCIPALAFAANVTLTVNSCVITGKDVTVTVSGAPAQAADGMYYLFELKPYEEEIGARQNYWQIPNCIRVL